MRDPSTKDGDVYSGGSRGGARGDCPPLFFDHTKARRVEKVFFFFETGSPPFYLRVWMIGLPRYLKVWIPQRRGFVQGGGPGEGPGGLSPLLFNQSEARRAEKVSFFETGSPPLYLRV